MTLDQSQKQLLTVLYGLIENKFPASHEMIEKGGRSFFQNGYTVTEDTFFSLTAQNMILQQDGSWLLTRAGEDAAIASLHEAMEQGSDKGVSRYAQSAAYHKFCTELYGVDLGQLNMLNQKQLLHLTAFLDLKPTDTVLELGCGNGYLAEYLTDRSGAFILGVDSARDAIELALQRTADRRNDLDFVSRDFNISFTASQKFNAIIAVDSLYQAANLEKVITNLYDLLAPQGKMALFYSERVVLKGKNQNSLADHTRLGLVLQKLGIAYQSTEFSEDEFIIWNNVLELADRYQAEFSAEGNSDLLTNLVQEAQTVLKSFDLARVRFMYECLAY